ncbi:MAG: flagellar biosynthesis protein FlhB [Epsilonproteobacteria bacterium]|nr:flagellar biosynthesis protein FlhB [Campylobacterota bacterium]
MADDQEKTEEPTSKKIEDARKEGNVPRSQDFSGFVTLLIAVAALFALFRYVVVRIEGLYRYFLSFAGDEITKSTILSLGIHTLSQLLLMVLPIAVLVAIGGILASFFQFGFIFTTKPLIPDLKKIDPIKGLSNLFSVKKMIESIKVVLKVSFVFLIAFYFLLTFIKQLPHVMYYSIFDQIFWLRDKAIILASVMLILFLVLSLADLLIVRYQYFKDLKMSKQEIKDEFKQMEGDPVIKSRIRKLQMELAQKRMMQEVPNADVIITNPTHYAVAIKYDKQRDKAPVVIAKGTDKLALKIKEIGLKHMIQIVENPPLARELYKLCEVDETIPEKLYKAVAEVLAFVYKSSKKHNF